MIHALAAALLGLVSFANFPAEKQPEPFAGVAVGPPANPPPARQAVKDPEPLPGSAFTRFFTSDDLGRLIVFYVRVPDSVTPERLPVILYVQGSGSQSVFTRIRREGSLVAGASGGQGIIAKAAGERAIVVIAEKPGVKFMECPARPGSAEEASQEFRNEHTLPRWATAVNAALHATLTLPRADASRVLVVGHSEGGLVACKVAADNPAVTHVATLAGGGPTQLFDLLELARQGTMGGSGVQDPQARVQVLLDQWDNVLKAPESADNDFLGHPHRRWTSFLATSPLEELKRTSAKVFIGQGLDDQAVLPASADVLFATLKAIGRDPEYSRVPGDHGFFVRDETGKPKGDGWLEMHRRVADWFLGSPSPGGQTAAPPPKVPGPAGGGS